MNSTEQQLENETRDDHFEIFTMWDNVTLCSDLIICQN